MIINRDYPEPSNRPVEVGLWCNICFLPSACKFQTIAQYWNGHLCGSDQTIIVCAECNTVLDDAGNPFFR